MKGVNSFPKGKGKGFRQVKSGQDCQDSGNLLPLTSKTFPDVGILPISVCLVVLFLLPSDASLSLVQVALSSQLDGCCSF